MFICRVPRFVFVTCTKSGSSTIYNVLNTHFQGKMHPRHHKVIPTGMDHYPSACVVRNPYSRMVSWWWSVCKAGGDRYGHKRELKQRRLPETLEGFLKLWQTKVGQSQYTVVQANNGIDHILKLENLEEDFNTLPFITKQIHIPHVNVKKHPHWRELLNPESGRLINRIYRQDFEEFGYEMMEF